MMDSKQMDSKQMIEAVLTHKRGESLRKSKQLRYVVWVALIVFAAVPIFLIVGNKTALAGTKVSYTVTPSSVPYRKNYVTNNTYNVKTKQYYMLRSYLERLEKTGGGTLILSKGTYVITNTLYIPSKVTILLRDGVTIRKGSDTGTISLKPSKSLVQFIAPSKSMKSGVAAKYDGETGIQIRGEGNATIDLAYAKDVTGLILGHNSNVLIRGITFQKMNGGNFVKLGACKDVILQDNKFRYYKASATGSKEAVALEIPDKVTNSFSYSWSRNDSTVNYNVTIQNNEFYMLERAIGSSKYSDNLYHTYIYIMENNIANTASHAVRILNWEKCIIKDNQFSQIANKEGSLKAILASGAKNPTITNNVFAETDRPIQIMPWKNTNNGSSYPITYNSISAADKEAIRKNTLIQMKEYVVRYNKTWNEFTRDTEKWQIFDPAVKAFTIAPATKPFQNNYTNYSTYNSGTKQYYMLRSYLEQLEKVGGGTLTLTAGTYDISNALYVASHITIYFEDGVILRKTELTDSLDMASAKSLFQLIAPSKAKQTGAYGGYEGETDIKFLGTGTVVFDLNYIKDAIGIVFGHNTKVTVSGITFQNMKSGHFIELDASENITIESNTFKNHLPSETGIKEAINIDTPDKNTEGFNVVWTKYDSTPNRNIMIENNYFYDLERAIGTHKYSEGKYHYNVSIINNKIEKTSSDAIRILNWSAPLIEGNIISKVNGGAGNDRAILASGVHHPVIQRNTFTDTARPIQLMPWKNSEGGSEYAITYNEVTQNEITAMLNNYLVRVMEPYIRVNKTYNVFSYETDKYYYTDQFITW